MSNTPTHTDPETVRSAAHQNITDHTDEYNNFTELTGEVMDIQRIKERVDELSNVVSEYGVISLRIVHTIKGIVDELSNLVSKAGEPLDDHGE